MISQIVRWADATGRAMFGFVSYCLLLATFLYQAFKALWVGRGLGQRELVRQLLDQIYFTGVQGVPPVLLLGLVTGVLAIVQGVSGVGPLSGTDNLGRLVTVLLIRELSPLVAGIVVIARSVTAVSAELGMMSVNRELEALEAMGIPPMRNVVAPRLLGGMISLAGLSIMFAASALVGGFIVSRVLFAYLPVTLFFGAVLSTTSLANVFAFVAKTAGGGLGLFLVACFHGMRVGSSPARVPVAVSRAARHGLVFLLLLHGVVDVIGLNNDAPSVLPRLLP